MFVAGHLRRMIGLQAVSFDALKSLTSGIAFFDACFLRPGQGIKERNAPCK
jgi:hypothetical protein